MPSHLKRHLVLGGSQGIGFAYAMWFAKHGAEVTIVARTACDLDKACAELRTMGAKAKALVADVLDKQALEDLLESIPRNSLDAIFIGGPSPPPGFLFAPSQNAPAPKIGVTPEEFGRATYICLNYPYRVLNWACATQQASKLITILSSSASKEPSSHHRFWSSAVLRRALDDIVNDIVQTGVFQGQIDVWRPKVVWTRLAERYAATIVSEEDSATPRERLAADFGLNSIPMPDAYVEQCINFSLGDMSSYRQ